MRRFHQQIIRRRSTNNYFETHLLQMCANIQRPNKSPFDKEDLEPSRTRLVLELGDLVRVHAHLGYTELFTVYTYRAAVCRSPTYPTLNTNCQRLVFRVWPLACLHNRNYHLAHAIQKYIKNIGKDVLPRFLIRQDSGITGCLAGSSRLWILRFRTTRNVMSTTQSTRNHNVLV